jgi:DNA polymerase IIIc chi subunit
VQTAADHIPSIALLSAAAGSAQVNSGPSSLLVGGKSMLQLQIDALAALGVARFLVEVDAVTGALLQILDANRKAGRAVEFVRSGADVNRTLQPNDRLWVQAENLYVAPTLLKGLAFQKSPFVVTMDGRDENEPFERIDINTRWAGIAFVDAAMLRMFDSLPEGWSMTSSVLRQALQDQTRRLPLPQKAVHAGDIRIVGSPGGVNAINSKILAERLGNTEGLVESKVLTPLAIATAPMIWRLPNGPRVVSVAKVASAGLALGLALFDLDIAALALGLTSIMLNAIEAATTERDDSFFASRVVPIFSWILLGLAAMIVPATETGYLGEGTLSVVMVVGLTLLAIKIELPRWAGYWLKSPALIALLGLLLSNIIGFADLMQWTSLGQLGVLVAAAWAGKAAEKKDQQA